MLRAVLILMFGVFLASCQSNQTPFVPAAVKQPGNGKLYVYWPAQRYREKSGQAPEIRLNDVPVGILRYKRYIELEMPAGSYELKLTGDSPEAKWTGQERAFPARIEPGEVLYVRLMVKYDDSTNTLGLGRMGYVVNFLPRAAQQAQLEIYGLKPVSP